MHASNPLTLLSWMFGGCLVAAAVAAQPARAPADAETRPTTHVLDGRVFQRLDANGDGRLTREEARIDPAVQAAFDRIDADGDGVVTREEARRYAEKAPADEAKR